MRCPSRKVTSVVNCMNGTGEGSWAAFSLLLVGIGLNFEVVQINFRKSKIRLCHCACAPGEFERSRHLY